AAHSIQIVVTIQQYPNGNDERQQHRVRSKLAAPAQRSGGAALYNRVVVTQIKRDEERERGQRYISHDQETLDERHDPTRRARGDAHRTRRRHPVLLDWLSFHLGMATRESGLRLRFLRLTRDAASRHFSLRSAIAGRPCSTRCVAIVLRAPALHQLPPTFRRRCWPPELPARPLRDSSYRPH